MDSNAIILAARLLESEEWTFTSKTNDVEFDDMRENEEVAHAEATVVWELEFDVRSWGVKSIYPRVIKVAVDVLLEDSDTGETRRISLVSPRPMERPKDETDVMGYLNLAALPYTIEAQKLDSETDYYRSSNDVSVNFAVKGVTVNCAARRIVVWF